MADEPAKGSKEYARAYGIKYRALHKEKAKAYATNYYINNKKSLRTSNKVWYEANKEKIKTYNAEYQSKNKETIKIKSKEWRNANKEHAKAKSAKYYADNKERLQALNKEWKKKNPEQKAALDKFHLILRRRLLAGQALAKIYRKETSEFYLNRPDGFHVDHIVPIRGKTVCGLHVPWNLQYLPATLNQSKGNKLCLI